MNNDDRARSPAVKCHRKKEMGLQPDSLGLKPPLCHTSL